MEMNKNKIKIFESWIDNGVEEAKDGAWAGFKAAWDIQQAVIDALTQNIESMAQTNQVLIKKINILSNAKINQ